MCVVVRLMCEGAAEFGVFWGCLKRSLCGYAAGGRDMDAGGSDGGPETSRSMGEMAVCDAWSGGRYFG